MSRPVFSGAERIAFLLAGTLLVACPPFSAAQAAPVCEPSALDSPYIPVDSWIYPAVMRLYSLGYIDSAYIGMRPWTRARVGQMVEEIGAHIEDADSGPVNDQAEAIYEALDHEINGDMSGPCDTYKGHTRIESVYSTTRILSGTPLRDSFHLGQTVINDYGRPYESGVSNYTGASGYATAGRFALYVRGEFQGAPSAAGYSTALAQQLSTIDEIPFINPVTNQPYNQATIPLGPIASVATGRLVEAYISTRVLNHEISFGKQDAWVGPGLGGAMAYSNNAENIYSFRINRAEPLRIPLLSRITGPFRYDFLVGSLKGHTYPNSPWVHMEALSFKPTPNLEIGFERTVIWGGKGHEPITLHTFLKSFFSFQNVPASEKFSPSDPGARFGSFDFAYRLPFLRNWVTLYADGEVHDDVSPIDAPRRAAWRPGIYFAHLPGAPSLDLRLEAVTSDPPITNSNGGLFMYFETIQRQGYTNKGNLFGDWVGREAKGGQAWLTWHLSGNEWLQFAYRNQKAAKDFIPGGTTLNDFSFQASKRVGRDFEVDGNFTLEKWKAPVYLPNQQTVTSTTIQFTWFPQRKVSF
ncbi:MAG TPA: capsule assembly Wzi family protein [Terracidiphilus sp.]|nr:capsule assembly Wzi family protein [Terracidiphilus sp.]